MALGTGGPGADVSHVVSAAELVLLGLGANLGEPLRQLAHAVARIRAFCQSTTLSSVYRTEPVGRSDQPDFYNLVMSVRTSLTPVELLARLGALERSMGRERTSQNAPRTIDLDILAYGDEVIETARLCVPHPRLHERGFVLYPLAEIAPYWRHPLRGQTPTEMIAAAEKLERVDRLGPLAPLK